MKDRKMVFFWFFDVEIWFDLSDLGASEAGFGQDSDDRWWISMDMFVGSYWQYFNHFWYRDRKYDNKQLCKI